VLVLLLEHFPGAPYYLVLNEVIGLLLVVTVETLEDLEPAVFLVGFAPGVDHGLALVFEEHHVPPEGVHELLLRHFQALVLVELVV